jgi:hypothetical protein
LVEEASFVSVARTSALWEAGRANDFDRGGPTLGNGLVINGESVVRAGRTTNMTEQSAEKHKTYVNRIGHHPIPGESVAPTGSK